MKILKIIFAVSIVFILFSSGYSQNDSLKKKIIFRNDTLTLGNHYTFIQKLENPVIGKLLGFVEDEFIVFTDKDIEEIDTSKILKILDPSSYLFGEYIESKEAGRNKTYYFLGAQLLFPKLIDGDGNGYNFGFGITANSLFTFSKYFGIRSDFDFYHINKEDHTYSYTYGTFSSSTYTTGNSVNAFLFRANLAFGDLNPEEPIMFYFLPGLGIGMAYYTKQTSTHTYSNYPSSTYTYDASPGFCIGVSLGAGMNFKINKKIRMFAEYQHNIWYLGDKGPPVFPAIKFGIIL
ncbi:MAG: outer membrane beta-barrel protein [Ignavibacteriae bacterium]|nr:outer membrane beta-barrel protein [Ignavibacteriota bacterium]